MTRVPRSPEAATTLVLKAAWPALASEIEIDPSAVSVCRLVSSVTVEFVGVPITAAELVIIKSPYPKQRARLTEQAGLTKSEHNVSYGPHLTVRARAMSPIDRL